MKNMETHGKKWKSNILSKIYGILLFFIFQSKNLTEKGDDKSKNLTEKGDDKGYYIR